MAAPAHGEPAPSLDLRGVETTTHPEGLSRLEPVWSPAAGEWNVGAQASYGYRPVVIPSVGGVPSYVAVRNQVGLDLTGSIGIGQRLSVGLLMPMILFQNGQTPPPGSGAIEPAAIAAGNLTLDARGTILEQGSLGGFGLAAAARVALPTGARRAYVAENQVRTEGRLLGELGVLGSSLRAAIGVRLRAADEAFGGEQFGDDLPWGLGLVIKPQAFGIDREGAYLFALEGHGAVALTPRFGERNQTPAALALRARRAFGDAHAVLGVELPLDGAAGVARVRAQVGVGWAPRVRDADADGIADEADQCQELAEDRDGFEDADGCPDFDNDGDGVPDGDDRCARGLEDADGFQDEDGCLDPDDDGDGLLDADDACPREAGKKDPDPKLSGCVVRDRDKDQIIDARDKCPARAEDRDGFQDEDGCPEWDNDADRVHDREDACPLVSGPPRSDPELNGCPSPDRDGDTFDDAADGCPEAAETFDGTGDDDGCPDTATQGQARPALVTLAPTKGPGRPRYVLKLATPIGFAPDGTLTPKAVPVVRAMASLLNEHPEMVLMVAVRPERAKAEAEQQALTRAFTVALALRSYTHRDEAAEVIGWKAVAKLPGATLPSGIGFLMLAPVAAPPAPATPRPAMPTPTPPGLNPPLPKEPR